MYVSHLQLTDFRSYASVDVEFSDGVSVLWGQNGQGKTNLVEAVEYVATLSSHRVAADGPLVRSGAEQAIVSAHIHAGACDARALTVDLEINPGRANRVRLNRAPLTRARDVLGALVVVLFSPEDLAVVKGDPSDRRRFLDDLVVARWPRLAGVRADYDKALRQRNSLLKAMSGRSRVTASVESASTLEAWDEHLARFGSELLVARMTTLRELAPYVAEQYLAIAPTNNRAVVSYAAGTEVTAEQTRDEVYETLLTAMARRRAEEIARGVSLVGPHRDDVALGLGELPAKGYASHGESWSLALSLRLGSFELLRADHITPVLILDDVFAELDATRRTRLAQSIVQADQVLVTAAVPQDVPPEIAGRRYVVTTGEVTPV